MRQLIRFAAIAALLVTSPTFLWAAQINLGNNQWALLTVPANVEEQTIESLFADELPIETLGTDWHIFLFDRESQSYVAPSRTESLKQGDGFWIIQSTGTSVTIDVPDSLPPADTISSQACVSSNGCFQFDIPTSDGTTNWALAGAPFDQPINVNDIRVQSNQQSCANGCSLAEAAAENLLGNNQWVYDSSASEYRSLNDISSLEPWQAFWVSTASSVTNSTELSLLLPSPVRGPDSEPGATFQTHHETIPNPVYNSDFRVAASCKSVAQNCFWDNPNTWRTGTVPMANSRVIVDGNVQVRDTSAMAQSIVIYPGGELTFSTDTDTQLQVADLIVLEDSLLQIGTENTPIDSARRAEIIFRDLPFDEADTEQHLHGLLALGGMVRVFGHAFDDVFLTTAIEPKSGDTQVSLAQSASKSGWRVGDALTIPTSTQCIDTSAGCPDETEDRIIQAISDDGSILSLNQALQFNHPGARDHVGTLDFTPHVINKSRNVIFRSENADGVRGHLLFHGRADVDIRYAAISDLGRTDIRNLGPENQKGRYPVHAHHLIGPVVAQNNGYQFSFVGNVIDFGEQNKVQNRKWGISVHDSHFGLVERNVVDHASGAAIVTESGSEMGNLFRENFVVRVVGGNGARTEDTDPLDGSKSGRSGTGFWFNGGGRNIYERNVAAAVAECVYCYGFKFDNVYNGDLLFPSTQGSDPHMAGGETINADAVGINDFVDNQAYAVPNGLSVWWTCTFGRYPNDDCSSRLDSFQLWHHHRWGYHGYPVNNMTLDNFVMRGDPRKLTNRFTYISGMEFGDYMHRNLLITNADIQNMSTAIQMSAVHHERGAMGPDIGFNTVKDSYLVATEGIGVWAPASSNGIEGLAPKTTIISNVQFEYPNVDQSGQERAHIMMHDTSILLDPNKMDLSLRNDVWVYNYNSAPGVEGDDLYIVPDYQGPSRCDNDIGQCELETSATFVDINKGHVYPLR